MRILKKQLFFLFLIVSMHGAVGLATRTAHAAETRLLIVGGGNLPALALARFCDWAGGASARILVVAWATEHPDQSFQGVSSDLAFCHAAKIELAPQGPLSAEQKRDVLSRLSSATAVFFTGGDQNRILDVLADPELLVAMRIRYRQGLPFGGTSAGTAIMSPITITGNGDLTVIDDQAVETRSGLGLLDGVILDTHFVRRQRENRLFGLVLKHLDLLGVGIDEDTALTVTSGLDVEVFGRAQVMLVEARGASEARAGTLRIQLLHAGDRSILARPAHKLH